MKGFCLIGEAADAMIFVYAQDNNASTIQTSESRIPVNHSFVSLCVCHGFIISSVWCFVNSDYQNSSNKSKGILNVCVSHAKRTVAIPSSTSMITTVRVSMRASVELSLIIFVFPCVVSLFVMPLVYI